MTDDEIIAPSHSQRFGPKTDDMGASVARGLNDKARMSFELSVVGCFSLVTKASICSFKLGSSVGVPEIGSKRSNMVRSEEFLNEQIRITCGVLHFVTVLAYISSRITEIKGVMPLPPLTITRVSYLPKSPLLSVPILLITSN